MFRKESRPEDKLVSCQNIGESENFNGGCSCPGTCVECEKQ